MKSLVCTILLLLASAPAGATGPGTGSGPFEGELALKITMRRYGQPTEMLVNLFIKGEDVAFRVQGSQQQEQGSIIYRGHDRLLWIINDAAQSYLELAADSEGAAMVGKRMDVASGPKPSSVRKTGKTKTLLGYNCEEVLVEEDSSMIDLWGTAKLASIYGGFMKAFSRMQGPGGGESPGGWQAEMLKLGLFPLQTTKTRKGEVLETQEVTKIDARALDSTMFRPPAGYARQAIEFDTGDAKMKRLLEQLKKKMEEQDSTAEQDSSRHHE